MSRAVSLTSGSHIRELLAHLRRDALVNFPNPDRDGCPGKAVLREMVFRRKGLDLARLPVSHIASCSPCFLEYTRLRKSAQHQRIGKILIAVAASILFVVGAMAFWPRRPSVEAPRIVQTPAPPSAPLATVMVNLASRTRGEAAESTRLSLPAKHMVGHFQMPIGSEPGLYEIRITQTDESVVTETNVRAAIKDGVTSFEVELSFEQLGGKQLTLSVRPAGLSWQRYPIQVE